MSGPHNKRVGRGQTFYKISGLYADDTITMSAINLPVFNTLFFKKRQHTKPYILNASLFEQL